MRHTWLCALVALLYVANSLQARPPDGYDIFSGWGPNENQWCGSLDWKDGQEKISITPLLSDAPGAGWILALPCNPSDVEIGQTTMPGASSGWAPPVALHGKLVRIGNAALATQLYPLLYGLFTPSLGWSAPLTPASTPKETVLHGIRCRILKVANAAALRQTVADQNVQLSDEQLARLARFADTAHCFACFTIASREAYETWRNKAEPETNLKGGWTIWTLSFPAAQPIIPAREVQMMEYGVYPDNVVISGFWKLAQPAPEGMRATPFRGGFYGEQPAYTRVLGPHEGEQVALVPAHDAWLHTTNALTAILSWPPALIAACVLWTILCSYLSGGLTGLLLARRWKPYARIALWNLGTIVVLRIRLARAPQLPDMASSARQTRFMILFSLIFLGIHLFLEGLLSAAFGSYAP
ncbi:MAG: hypothetical protein ACTHN5_18440 [Phycisphaerae bacterium]